MSSISSKKISPINSGPEGVRKCSGMFRVYLAIIYNSQLYIFGGERSSGNNFTVNSFNLLTTKWTSIPINTTSGKSLL
jgi:hypothetical protein